MFTPQEVQEQTFDKAVFGGYDMGCVDDFLEPLTNDYIALYKENSVLKSKLKIVVEKLEEYRSQEDAMKKTMVTAQKAAEAITDEAQRKAEMMMMEAESIMRNKSQNVQQLVDAEDNRVEKARQAAATFIDIIEKDVARHLELLKNLKMMDLPAPSPKIFDYDRHATRTIPQIPVTSVAPVVPVAPIVPVAPVAPVTETQEDMVAQIAQNIGKIVDDGSDLDSTRVARRDTGKYPELQFGKNYDPTLP
ncbi:MAG: DivIVA domain-containing protein [Eubacteriales bacterium]